MSDWLDELGDRFNLRSVTDEAKQRIAQAEEDDRRFQEICRIEGWQ